MDDRDRYHGVVVEDGSERTDAGLFLRTADGTQLRLIADPPFVQMTPEHAHESSRREFETLLNRSVTMTGHREGNTLWSATLVEPAAG